MIKTNPNVDYGKALTKFKTQLQAVTAAKKESGEDYALNFGRLQGASQALLIECCQTEAANEAPTILRYDNNPDDIPTGLYEKPGAGNYLAD